MRQSEEPRQDAHWDAVRALPAVDRLDCFPLLLLNKCHEGVHVSCAGVSTELAVCDVENSGQGGHKESSGKSRVITKIGRTIYSLAVGWLWIRYLHNINFGNINGQVITPRSEIAPDGLEILACGTPRSETEMKRYNSSIKCQHVKPLAPRKVSLNIHASHEFKNTLAPISRSPFIFAYGSVNRKHSIFLSFMSHFSQVKIEKPRFINEKLLTIPPSSLPWAAPPNCSHWARLPLMKLK